MNRTILRSSYGAVLASFVFAASALAQVAIPQLEPVSGVLSPSEGVSEFHVVVTCSTPGVTIRYTTNGSEPTTGSTIVANGGTVMIGHNLTLKVKAWDGATPGTTAAASYYIGHAVAAGDFHSMASDFDGKLTAWGSDQQGRLGHMTIPRAVPHVSMSSGVIDIDGGADDTETAPQAHSVLLKDDGTVWCAGSPAHGRLGNNSTIPSGPWVQTFALDESGTQAVPLVNIRAVAAGSARGIIYLPHLVSNVVTRHESVCMRAKTASLPVSGILMIEPARET